MHSVLVIFVVISSVVAADVEQCCPEGQVVLTKTKYCWEPHTNTTKDISLTCKNVLRIKKGFSITAAGELQLSISKQPQIVEGDFCVGNLTDINDVNLTEAKPLVVLCTGDEEDIVDDVVLGCCMIVSVIFLSLTAIIYATLKELRDLQGKSIVNFCASLAIGLGILVIMKLINYSDMSLCAVRGFLAYFFLIASFFWTNAISIQVLISTRQPAAIADYGWKDFIWYAIYAWGCPAVLTICMAIVNFHPGDHQKPGIGLNHCWFFTKTQQWYYMYSVMSILISANICIFIYTSTVIWRHSFSSTHLKALRYKFVMTIRLIILMGLPWVFEMIGSLSGKHIIWAILDVFNTLQGLLIFLLLVVFRKRVIKVMHKHGWLDCISGPIEKYLAVGQDDEDIIQHTDIPMGMNGNG